MTNKAKGGCLCGAVRFEATLDAPRMVQCHCSDCQKVSGGAPSFLVGLPSGDFQVTEGAPAEFAVTGASGKPVRRFFCAACGTPLHSKPEAFAGFVFVKVGAFDSDPDYKPAAAVWTGSAPAWHGFPEGAALFVKGSDGPRR